MNYPEMKTIPPSEFDQRIIVEMTIGSLNSKPQSVQRTNKDKDKAFLYEQVKFVSWKAAGQNIWELS